MTFKYSASVGGLENKLKSFFKEMKPLLMLKSSSKNKKLMKLIWLV
jgi:hypothetical protein